MALYVITGTDFQIGATVTFGGVSATAVTVQNSTCITCTPPVHAVGIVDIVVTNPDLSYTTLSNGFTYVGQTIKVDTTTFENGTSGTHGYIKFTPTDADGYNVYRSNNLNTNFEWIGATTGGTYTDNTVRNQKEYRYYVVGTSLRGASLPSNIVTGFVCSDQFDYLNNSLQALQTSMKTNLTFLNDVKIGNYDVLPEQLPLALIYAETDKEENVTVGYTGQLDKIYNIIIRVYGNGAGQDNEDVNNQMTRHAGKVQSLLEALKTYAPYWYLSNIEETNYGEEILDEIVLRYVDIKWTCKRRVLRSN